MGSLEKRGPCPSRDGSSRMRLRKASASRGRASADSMRWRTGGWRGENPRQPGNPGCWHGADGSATHAGSFVRESSHVSRKSAPATAPIGERGRKPRSKCGAVRTGRRSWIDAAAHTAVQQLRAILRVHVISPVRVAQANGRTGTLMGRKRRRRPCGLRLGRKEEPPVG